LIFRIKNSNDRQKNVLTQVKALSTAALSALNGKALTNLKYLIDVVSKSKLRKELSLYQRTKRKGRIQ